MFFFVAILLVFGCQNGAATKDSSHEDICYPQCVYLLKVETVNVNENKITCAGKCFEQGCVEPCLYNLAKGFADTEDFTYKECIAACQRGVQ